jgi:hypothetical protein
MSRVPSCAHGSRRLPVVCFLVVATLLLALGVAPRPALAAGEHHAAVIVDTGTDVHQVVITFSDDSISGLEALQLAGANPSVVGFSGIGGAVCGLYGVGHPATNATCLGEPSDPKFWAYWHVPAGQAAFDNSTYSRAGAGSVRVHDGDTDGWRYGTGEAPAFVQLEFPAPVTPATAPPAAVEPAPPSLSGGGKTGGEMGLPSSASTTTTIAPTPAEAAAAAAAAAGSSATSTTRNGTTAEVATEQASASRDADDGGGSPVLSFVGFGAVMVVLVAGIFFARRARIGRSPGGS